MRYKYRMRPTREADEMREALQFLMHTQMPAQHKRVLLEALTGALREEEAAQVRAESQNLTNVEWRPHETEAVETALRGHLARSWQHGDEVLMRLAAELHRHPNDVRAKAGELGLGSGVDYALAKKDAVAEE
jgi:hypothetical protein